MPLKSGFFQKNKLNLQPDINKEYAIKIWHSAD